MRTAVQITLTTEVGVTESANGTRIPPSDLIVDSIGNRWTTREIVAGSGFKYVFRDEQRMGCGAVHAMKYFDRVVWFWDSGGWHDIIGSGPQLGAGSPTEPGTGEPPPPLPNRDPVWDMALVVFDQGIAAALDLRTRASDPDGNPLTFEEVSPPGEMPTWLSWDANTFRLAYDGSDLGLVEGDAPIEFDSALVLSADDGVAPGNGA